MIIFVQWIGIYIHVVLDIQTVYHQFPSSLGQSCLRMCYELLYKVIKISNFLKLSLLINRHSSCTPNVYKLQAYGGAGSTLSCASMRIGCLVPVDWRWFIQFSHHSTWQVDTSPVLIGIDNKPTIKKNTPPPPFETPFGSGRFDASVWSISTLSSKKRVFLQIIRSVIREFYCEDTNILLILTGFLVFYF